MYIVNIWECYYARHIMSSVEHFLCSPDLFWVLKWRHRPITMKYFRSLWKKISAPEKIWWRSIRACECPRLCSTASPTAWHETNERMWWRFSRCPPCSNKTHQHTLLRQKPDFYAFLRFTFSNKHTRHTKSTPQMWLILLTWNTVSVQYLLFLLWWAVF